MQINNLTANQIWSYSPRSLTSNISISSEVLTSFNTTLAAGLTLDLRSPVAGSFGDLSWLVITDASTTGARGQWDGTTKLQQGVIAVSANISTVAQGTAQSVGQYLSNTAVTNGMTYTYVYYVMR